MSVNARLDARPDVRAVAERAIALRFACEFAFSAPILGCDPAVAHRDELNGVDFTTSHGANRPQLLLSLGDLRGRLTPTESALAGFITGAIDPALQIDAMWRTESLQVLAWALGFRKLLGPWDLQTAFTTLRDVLPRDAATLVANARLRPQPEIEAAREQAEAWHWRHRTRALVEQAAREESGSRAAALHRVVPESIATFAAICDFTPVGADFPVRGKAYQSLSPEEWANVASISIERHFALNWLCGMAPGNAWDETPTDT